MSSEPNLRVCARAECGRTFRVPSFAQHKRFCSDACRKASHREERKEAIAEFRVRQSAATSAAEVEAEAEEDEQ